jgi:hypothetical protein
MGPTVVQMFVKAVVNFLTGCFNLTLDVVHIASSQGTSLMLVDE